MRVMKQESAYNTGLNSINCAQSYPLDQYDRRIMQELDQNARKSLADLSKKVGLSRDAIRNRIKKMMNSNIISAFKPVYNVSSLGYPLVNYVFISLANPNEEEEKKFVKFLKTHKHITHIANLIGKWDYILNVMAENQARFDKILKEIRYHFPNLIKDYEIYGVLKEHEYEETGKLVY